MNNLLIPKIDVVFHSLFRVGNESITKSFISSIIGREIDTIKLDTDRHLLTKKPGILDLKAVLDDGILCDIEIQLVDNHNTQSRFLYYWCRLFSSQLAKGEDYAKLKKTICIAILDYEVEFNDSINFHTKWKIINSENRYTILTDLFELHIIELPKVLKAKNQNNPMVQWMLFLNNPNQTEVLEMSKKNLDIEEAMELLNQISQDKKLQRAIELRHKAKLDETSARSSNIEYGRKEGSKEIAKKLLLKNMDIQTISEVTNLSLEEIKKLKKTL